ncbi:hypothetical protein Tco_1267831 [Tanacetum coccineum]
MESVIRCATTKETWTNLVNSFESSSDTKENRIMDLKLKYNTFRDKPSESLSQTYTQYKTFLNELSNDGVKLCKHEINVGFMNSLPKKWLSFSQGLRNGNHTQTLDLADIYGRIFQENFDDEVDERTNDEYLRDLDIESNERARLARMSRDVITVDSKIRIPMYQGEYSQWLERFMNYLEEQTDSASMICSLTHGEQPLHVVTQVPIAGTAPNAPIVHKDPKLWTTEEKWIRMIDRLARSILIQGLPNDIYSLIDSNDTAQEL